MKDVIAQADALALELRWPNVRDIVNGRSYQVGAQTKITVYTSKLDQDGIPEIALSPKGLRQNRPIFWQWISYLQNSVGTYAKPKFGQKYPRVAVSSDEQLSHLFLCIREYVHDGNEQCGIRELLSDLLVTRTAWNRSGQTTFRASLLEAYGGSCAVSGCRTQAVLEAAHIVPYRREQSYEMTNGLLLRADLHALFDARIIAIDPNTRRIIVSTDVSSDYGMYQGQALAEPQDRALRVSNDNILIQHREFEQRETCAER
jgi:hypothetical protein